MDAPGNDGNASMPEQVKRPNPWRKIIIIIVIVIIVPRDDEHNYSVIITSCVGGVQYYL